ncbi:hypothetical protein A3K79_07535 [Candidatus Bathyarchaeota archaeon RBG_13_46_16b]|nr:MAG: hypothetical protein A3K79_07535 [Candidatus Bathyarchaeota archaeon RBG_13_46_16b]
MDKMGSKQRISFDDSALEASLNYLRNRSDINLKRLISKPGNRLAYNHYLWSSSDSKMTIEEFWREKLSRTFWSRQLESDINAIQMHLKNQEEKEWLQEILRYLPEGHVFTTTAYLILGYDNVVFGEDVALNMGFGQFHLDKRESTYYLIHELAHVGYVRYHPLPELWNIRTVRELLDVVRFLTHLEGMGVISALKLRISQGGTLDGDYKTLLDDAETARRVDQYFKILDRLGSDLNKRLEECDFQVFEEMSRKKTRLWYIAGCHMAQEIEKRFGIEMLRKLVKQGSTEFFNKYYELEDRLREA